MNCRNCGYVNIEGTLFCERCGSTFARSSDPLATSLSSPSGLFRTVNPSPTSPLLPRSLTAEFRSFPLDSPYLAVPTPVMSEQVRFEDVEASRLRAESPGAPAAASESTDASRPFSTLRPSETLWIIDGVLMHLFEEELATIPDRRFLHVKLMEGDDELYFHPFTADYWDRVEPLIRRPGAARRLSIFHRPTDIVPGYPFMNFGVELELDAGAGEDLASESIRIAFRMKYYYSGREEELLDAFRYTKPVQLAISVIQEIAGRVGRPIPQTASLFDVLELLASGKSDLVERVLGRVRGLRASSDSQRVALASELYGMILGVRLESQQTRVMVADDQAFLASLVQSAQRAESGPERYFKYKRVTPRMGILLRSH